MKCESVACIWSTTPPSHRVTAVAVLNNPPTLYTAAFDGSIIWWNLTVPDSNSSPDIKRVAMLCGHAAPVTDLSICYPTAASESGNKGTEYTDTEKSSSENYGALISVCTDGVLCVWSRSSGHCTRRRKLPPWVGSPSLIQTLPMNPRYVCIGCSADNVHPFDYKSLAVDKVEQVTVDRESTHRIAQKCTVIIVDTYTLTIVQTVFHGNSFIGPLKFMTVVPSVKSKEKHSVLLTDAYGRAQLISVTMDPHTAGESEKGLHKSPNSMEVTGWVGRLKVEGPILSIANQGNIIAFVLRSCCVFKVMPSGTLAGEISFAENPFCVEGDSTQLHVTGGCFLVSNNSRKQPNFEEHSIAFVEFFSVWNDIGSAVVYSVSYLDNIFKYEVIYEIPAASYPQDMKLSASFVQLDQYILRIESACLYYDETSHWKPLITIWALHLKDGDDRKICGRPKVLGEGGLSMDSIESSTSSDIAKGTSNEVPKSICAQAEGLTNEYLQKGQVVTSSMVIYENFYTPYAVVYGFLSGDIEVVRFEMCHLLDSYSTTPHLDMDSHISKQYFWGHKGAVLCLAAHQMLGSAEQGSFKHVLVSGSYDCTVCIWDLDSGNLITVMHQHVSPVRQLILPPVRTQHPWSNCFLSVGEDACVSLVSLETLQVERIFPGHPSYPANVVWDGMRGYVACLWRDRRNKSDAVDVLFIWDIKTGARERVLRGAASHSMFDYFCKGIKGNSFCGSVLNGNTSVSSLLFPITENGGSSHSYSEKGVASTKQLPGHKPMMESNAFRSHSSKESSSNMFSSFPSVFHSSNHPINCSCPFPGVAFLSFDLEALMSPGQNHELSADKISNVISTPASRAAYVDDNSRATGFSSSEEPGRVMSVEESIIRFSLSFLHLWNVDIELDQMLVSEMKLKRPDNFLVASGLLGDKGSLTLTFPGPSAILELWKSSSEFCALRSLAVVSLAERLIGLCHSGSAATSALAAFYARNFADKYPEIKPPLLQLLVSFWQDDSEHVSMAARSLFHCAASRAIPHPLCRKNKWGNIGFITEHGESTHETSTGDKSFAKSSNSNYLHDRHELWKIEESKFFSWLESNEMQDWISSVGGTIQDARTSRIIVAAALAIWYPSLVKQSLPMLVVHPLMKLGMAMNENYSSTAAELLAEGMENTWKELIVSEIPYLLGDIYSKVECVSTESVPSTSQNSAVPAALRETLVGVLLPSLAIADILAFLTVLERQVRSSRSDSPVHSLSLKTLTRVIHGSPRNLAQYLDKAVMYILHTMDPRNSVLRKSCFQSSMTVLKEVVRAFPMVALNKRSTCLAVGAAIGEINNAIIRIYDMHSLLNIKVLDANAPPGVPEVGVTTVISALSFSPDGEGIIAFSEHGLTIRWWSLGSSWWEKLSRSLDPVRSTKLIFVTPWDGLSPTSIRSSIMGIIAGNDGQTSSQDNTTVDINKEKLLIKNIDLSYRLEWVTESKVLLTRHGHELGSFQI